MICQGLGIYFRNWYAIKKENNKNMWNERYINITEMIVNKYEKG